MLQPGRHTQTDQARQVLDFCDYWKDTAGHYPEELVFDSKLTTYKKLSELNQKGVRFLTLRRKSTGVIRKLMSFPEANWTRCRLDVPHRKYRNPKIIEEIISLKGYQGTLRQIAAKNLGRDLPTLLITNDLKSAASLLLARYAKRMLIENAISDGVHFFHLDALCSSLNVEVDFSVMLTVVANGLYHIFAKGIKGFEQCNAKKLYRKFINTIATIEVTQDEEILVHLTLRAHNPLLMEAGFKDRVVRVPWLRNASVHIKIPTDVRKS